MKIFDWEKISYWFESVDWETWSHFSMPILTFLAFIVYTITLRTAVRQNRITSSSSRLANYEEEIEDLQKEGLEIIFAYGGKMPPTALNVFTFWDTFYEVLRKIEVNPDMQEDSEELKMRRNLSWAHIDSRSYRSEFMFLSPFFNSYSELNIFFHRIDELLREINSSNLMPEHKNLLKRRIRRKLLKEYLVQVVDIRFRGVEFKKHIPYLSRDKEVKLGDLDMITIAQKYDKFQKLLK